MDRRSAGWSSRSKAAPNLRRRKRDADFFHPVDLHRLYTKITVSGAEKIGDRDTYVLEATVPEGSEPTKMYFDMQTGLLVRAVSQHHGADGITQYREDFEDYRDVDGIKVPFTTHQTNGDTTYTTTISGDSP